MNALVANIKSRHIDEEAVKLAKRYPEEYEKAAGLIQQAVLQRRKQIHRGVRATVDYTISDSRNAASEGYKDLTAPTSADLKDVGLRREGQRLIEDVPPDMMEETCQRRNHTTAGRRTRKGTSEILGSSLEIQTLVSMTCVLARDVTRRAL